MTGANVKRYAIAFSFDENILVAAQVAIHSLLVTAPENVRYDIVLTYAKHTLSEASLAKIVTQIESAGHTCHLIDVGDAFKECFEIRGITVPTYYRLLLPELLPSVDQIIYSDVDIIFRQSPHSAADLLTEDDWLAGVKNVYRNKDVKYLQELGLESGKYINAGFIVMNLSKMREHSLQSRFIEMSRTDYTYQDQDILNITCAGHIRYLPERYNIHAMHDYSEGAGKLTPDLDEELKQAVVLHYAGVKPWNSNACFYYDQWWEAYRQSPAYDFDFYFKHQRESMARQQRQAHIAGGQWAKMQHMTKAQRLRSILKPFFWS
ncbi:glycosyltransferase family 8 protein [Cerasicoccus maritimus]|uniref:glycosyltransferase family 8 protein n=1 Tax=Cerasicoccus maritimus TaxID=490089 RepID=UPI002852CF53|nr:glycosyltransferase family 8 protein [Cerasicoccus maritimus]